MAYIVAVDSGGTFTDCTVLDEDGTVTRGKTPSTPPNFDVGVLNSVQQVADRLGLTLEELLAETQIFAHGTTVATNILITRTGAKAALLTTRGHEDAVLIGRTVQKVAGLSEEEIIDVARLSKAEPLVPRARIFGINERVDSQGREVVPLNVDPEEGFVNQLHQLGVESIAVSFLWSFLNPAHEEAMKELLGENGKNGSGWFVTTSSDLVPVIREYERTSTTLLNAYLTPGVRGYLERMRDKLRGKGLKGAVAVMHSAGGVSSVDEAKERGVTLLASGPAGGVLGAQYVADQLDMDRVIVTDVGGTSFDVAVIVNGAVSYAEEPVFDKFPVALPVVDVTSIGAGGGSIAWVEKGAGVLKVGPQSAGADPGPACYGKGGDAPTVTDANLVLGRLNPSYFLGGRIELDEAAARGAIEEGIAGPLGLTVEQAAAAIVDIVDAQMADLIRRVTISRGEDPSQFVVFAYGGASGLHVGSYASKLGCERAVVPSSAAVFSAFGIAASDAKMVSLLSQPTLAPFEMRRWRERFEKLELELTRKFSQENLPTADLRLQKFAELQFRGQAHTVRVPIEDDDLSRADRGESIIERFVDLYESKYGRGSAYRQAGVEAVTFAVEAAAALPKPKADPRSEGASNPEAARVEIRRMYDSIAKTFTETPVYRASRLEPGHRIEGAALIEAEDMTLLVNSGQELRVDPLGNYRLRL